MERLSEQKREQMKQYLRKSGMLFPSEKEKRAHLSGRYSSQEIDLFLNRRSDNTPKAKFEQGKVQVRSVNLKVLIWYAVAVGMLLFRQFVMSGFRIKDIDPQTESELYAYIGYAILNFVMLIAPIAIIAILSIFVVKKMILKK